MAEDANQVAVRPSNQDLTALPLAEAIEAYTPQFAEALPDHIELQRFKRTVLTALNQNPDLAKANRRSFFLACVKCAHDGLFPDGREAALVAYGGVVQYLPMIAGIRKRMRNTGEVLSATAEVVHKNDTFRYVKGEEPRIEHEPCALDQDRGDPVGAYAIIKLANGETLREVMGLHEIERVRAFSRNAQGKASPWVTSWGEMARKTVMRRCSKSAPIASELDRLLARDEEIPEGFHVPARPTRDQFRSQPAGIEHVDTGESAEATAEDEQVTWVSGNEVIAEVEISGSVNDRYVVSLSDGTETNPLDARTTVQVMIAEIRARAKQAGLDGLSAAIYDNRQVYEQLEKDDHADLAMEIRKEGMLVMDEVQENMRAGRSATMPQNPAHPEPARASMVVPPNTDGPPSSAGTPPVLPSERANLSAQNQDRGPLYPSTASERVERRDAPQESTSGEVSAHLVPGESRQPSHPDTSELRSIDCKTIAIHVGLGGDRGDLTRGKDWKRTTPEVIRLVKTLTKEEHQRFRGENKKFLEDMSVAWKDGWNQVKEAFDTRGQELGS